MSCGAMIRTNIAVLSLVHEVGDCVADHSRIARCASRRRALRWPRCWRRRHGRTARRAGRTDAWRTRRRAARFPWAAYRRDRAWRRLPRLARSLLLAALFYYYGPGYYYAPAYYYPPPVVAAPAPAYWYYCAPLATYYPYVQDCPGGWQAVTPGYY